MATGCATHWTGKGLAVSNHALCITTLYQKKSELQSDSHVDITCADFRRFEAWEPNVLEATVDMLTEASLQVERGAMTQTKLKQLEKSVGFNANRRGLMADKDMRCHFHACEVNTMDWVHTALQNGFLTLEAHLFLGACKNVGFYPRDIEAYLKGEWCFPASIRSKGKNLHNVFNEFRAHACASADK